MAKNKYLSKEEELTLINKFIEGDDSAWGELYKHFFDSLKGYILGKTQNYDDADDICSNILEKAKNNLSEGKYNSQYRFSTFLRNISNYELKGYFNKNIILDTANDFNEFDNTSRTFKNDTTESPEQDIRNIHSLDLLTLIIKSGSKPHQIVAFENIILLGWKPKEIATERSQENIKAFQDDFQQKYYGQFERTMDYTTFCKYFLHLTSQLYQKWNNIYSETEYVYLKDFPGEIIGNLIIKIFCNKRLEDCLSDWCYKVKERARKYILKRYIDK